jgi:hypothetical protein
MVLMWFGEVGRAGAGGRRVRENEHSFGPKGPDLHPVFLPEMGHSASGILGKILPCWPKLGMAWGKLPA